MHSHHFCYFTTLSLCSQYCAEYCTMCRIKMCIWMFICAVNTDETKSIWKMLGPFATASRLTPIHQMSLAVLSRAACASMSTTTATTAHDRGDRYGPMEWAQLSKKVQNSQLLSFKGYGTLYLSKSLSLSDKQETIETSCRHSNTLLYVQSVQH